MIDHNASHSSDAERPPSREPAYCLIADPDHRRAALYRDIVETTGLEAIVTRNGDEAKAMLRRRELPALVVANLSLPRLDGFALLAELRRLAGESGPPVIVISSSKELSGAAWNLKERLGVTELLPGDASDDQIRDAIARLRPRLPYAAHQAVPTAAPPPSVLQDRWICDTIDRVASDVARRFSVGLVFVSVLIGEQEWFRVHVNLSYRPTTGRSSPRTWSFVRQVLEAREPIVVPDVLQHPVFSRAAFPPAGTVRGYAGVPVMTSTGTISGVLCLFDLEPLTLDARGIDALSETANRLALELEAGIERAHTHERFTALSRLALTDPVTGLTNRRGGEEALAREVARARRSGSPLSLVLFDIDHFKSINDQAGHAVGDRVLRGISDILSASQRGSDLAMRWGGEEFLVLLPDVGLAGARTFAERVREHVQNLVVADAGRITISAGVAELRLDEDPAAALRRADANLYKAKAAGRNRVEWDENDSIDQPAWMREE
ncbi:MAG TPA: diguanylate cyclase [Vicinamibacterales bacterium]|nr:diguanylate cyclase [Vicinamibacterales bacterium]